MQALRNRFHRPVRSRLVDTGVAGYWQIVVTAPGQPPLDISMFRGLPTQLGTFGFDDPFDESTFVFTLPGASIFDARGYGDLAWCVHDANVDLRWHGDIPPGYPQDSFDWEGSITSFEPTSSQLAVQCAGAMRQVDLYLAKPGYPAQPLPYEVAIARQFAGRPDLRVSPLRVEWPDWWKTVFTTPPASTPGYMIPDGVKGGDRWTALLTRSTGSWDVALTGYVQSLLSSMYTSRGRWTLCNDPGRKSVLRHRDMRTEPADTDVVINAVDPDVEVELSEDWSQSANAAFGQGSSLSGVAYTGMEVSADGLTTSYQPLSAARQVDPQSDSNGWYDRSRFRREVLLELQAGLDEDTARGVATAHLQRFGEPGHTGTITLGTDPMLGGVRIPRFLVKAGMTVRVPRILGSEAGIVLHVTSSTHDFGSEKTTLTVDSKYRDALTVAEVRARGRDALTVTRMLVAGQYNPPVPDQLYPWNYAEGSGCIPSGTQQSSLRLFRGMPDHLPFPWEAWTTAHPPKSAAWRDCYIPLGPASSNADKNWTHALDNKGALSGIPIRMSQAGAVRLIQVAAYDANGKVLPVGFHLSLYGVNSVNYQSTPRLPANYESAYPPYKAGQHFPFFPQAWENYHDDGTAVNPEQAKSDAGASMIRAWGSSYEKAGYWPGSSAAHDPPTGLLVDEAPWSFDLSNIDASSFDIYSTTRNLSNPLAGKIYAMIWCDQQLHQPVYFLGRIFRAEPGSTT